MVEELNELQSKLDQIRSEIFEVTQSMMLTRSIEKDTDNASKLSNLTSLFSKTLNKIKRTEEKYT